MTVTIFMVSLCAAMAVGMPVAFALLVCAVLAWRVMHPSPVEPVVIRVPVAAPATVVPPAPVPVTPPRDTRLDWARSLAVPGMQVDATEARVRLVFDQPVFQTRDQLKAGADALLRQVAAAFAPHAGGCVLVVAGHTDDDPPRVGGPYRDNVALGYLRALAASDVLRAAGVPPAALRVTSAGDQGAPFPNTDAAGKQRNRTVTLQVERSAGG